MALLARFFLGQSLGRAALLSLAVVATGCGLVFFDAFRRSLDPLGLALAFGASATYSFYFVILQVAVAKGAAPDPDLLRDPLRRLTFNILGEPAYLLRIDRVGLTYGGGLALFSTVMGLAFLYLGVERLDSAHAAVIFTFEPISVVILSGSF